MNLPDRISVDPEILVGKPVVRGTRMGVDFLLGLMAQGFRSAALCFFERLGGRWPSKGFSGVFPNIQKKRLTTD